MKKNILLTLALLFAIVWTGCQREQLVEDEYVLEPEVTQEASEWTITLQAVRTDMPQTKGLAIGDGEEEALTASLKSVWNYDEEVSVFLGTGCIGTLRAAPESAQYPHSAVLCGTVTCSSITPGSTRLTFISPRADIDYTGQMGNLLSGYSISNPIETMYNYVIASDVLVTDTYANNIITETAIFVPMQSVYRMSFRFQDGDNKTPIVTKHVDISGASGHLVQSQTVDGSSLTNGDISVSLQWATSDPFFVALRNEDETNAEVFTFTVVDEDGATYKGTKTIPAADKANGTFLSMKNATLTSRLDMPLNSTTKDVVL